MNPRLFAAASIVFAVASCAPSQKDPYDTGDLYGYPDAGLEQNPDGGGSLYDVPADFEEGAAPVAEAQPEPSSTTYTVVAGDSLSRISKKHGVSIQAIMDANNLTNPNMVRVGQTLTIPAH